MYLLIRLAIHNEVFNKVCLHYVMIDRIVVVVVPFI